jgi:hypothetical protein
MTYAEDRTTRFGSDVQVHMGARRPGRAYRTLRIHFDLDFWQPVAGYKGVWESRPEAIRRLQELWGS